MKKLFGLGKGLGSLIPSEQTHIKPQAQKESIFSVEINKIKTNPDQPREEFDDDKIGELSKSIRKHGIIQPLLVSKIEIETLRGLEVSYQLIAGERRLRAARLAGLPQVPVVIRDLEPNESTERLELALIENIQREDLNPMEEARAYDRLQKEFGLTQKEVAEKVGKSRELVANTVRLLGLPKDIRESLQVGKISRAHARALLAFDNPEQQMEMYKKILSEGISSRDLETVAAQTKNPNKSKGRSDSRFNDLQENLKERLKVPVLIKATGNGGKIEIRFATVEELTKIAKNIID
jgi:ParB family transcriptional regulator, chromosome partitioning protein